MTLAPCTAADFPPPELFEAVCRKGLSAVRPLSTRAATDAEGWNFGSARPPSYQAYGRLRALLALSEARRLCPRRVFEVAAGDAALSACLEQAGCQVTANDLRREELETAVRRFRNGGRIRLAPGNIFDITCADTGRFDLVIASEVIEHVAHAVDLLSHLRSFLEPGGCLLLTTPNGAYFRNRLPTYSEVSDFRAFENGQFQPDADGHLYLITPADLHAIATAAGYEVRRLLVWGTPFISGGCGFRWLSRLLRPRLCYSAEMFCQRLAAPLRRRLANSLSAVLAPLLEWPSTQKD